MCSKTRGKGVPTVNAPAAQDYVAPQFEKLLSDASAAFIRALADEIDSEIEKWLQRFCTAFSIHKAVLVQLDPTDGKPRATHQWTQGDVIPSILATAAEDYPWLISKITSGELIVLEDVDDTPPDATNDLLQMHKRGGKAGVCVPLRIGNEIAGAVVFGSAVRRKWTPETVRQLQRLTEIFGIALERQQSQAVIRKLREESQNVLRVVPMAELTASLAHELNQPLGAILNNAQAARRLLSARRPDVEEVKDAVEEIVHDVNRITDIVRHTREVLQSAIPEKEPVDLRELLLDIERVVRNDAKAKGISLRVSVPPSLPTVVANRQGLIQVLMNLVLNAFDAVSERSEGTREVELSANRVSTEVHIKVRDTGKGIDPLIRPRLFDAFVTTKPKGTGMGLAIARSVIEKNGGHIWAAQQTAPGATIEFTLPIEVRA
jgi:signal transduction histidine kinase